MSSNLDVPFVTIEEYLRTDYEPHADYVDGRIVDRNAGMFNHSSILTELTLFFAVREKEWPVKALPILTMRTGETRFRVADVAVLLKSHPREQILVTPPTLCIEVLSDEDRWSPFEQRIGDYFRMGVPVVWVFDPYNRVVTVIEPHRPRRYLTEGCVTLEGTPVSVPIADIFAAIDDPLGRNQRLFGSRE